MVLKRLRTYTTDPGETVTMGYRLLVVDHEVYYSSQFTRVKAKNSCTVKYSADGVVSYGEIHFFASLQNHLFAFIHELSICTTTCKHHSNTSHDALDCIPVSKIVPVCWGDLVCVPVTALIRKCVLVKVNDSVNKVLCCIISKRHFE